MFLHPEIDKFILGYNLSLNIMFLNGIAEVYLNTT